MQTEIDAHPVIIKTIDVRLAVVVQGDIVMTSCTGIAAFHAIPQFRHLKNFRVRKLVLQKAIEMRYERRCSRRVLRLQAVYFPFGRSHGEMRRV